VIAPTRILVTGATGFVGMGVATALAGRGYAVSGTARTAESVARLTEIGVAAVEADLHDGERLAHVARRAQVVVHCAFGASGPADDVAAAIALEQRATAILADAARDAGGTLIYTSGVGVLAGAGPYAVQEDAVPRSDAPMRWRYDLERLVADAGGRVIRPALVYGHGGNMLVVDLIRRSAARGAAGYLGDGRGSLPTVHRDDLAEAYARAIESGASGSTYTVIGGYTTARQVAEAIGRLIGAPDATASLEAEVVARELPTAQWITGDVAVDAVRVRRDLGWRPHGPTLLEEIESGSYAMLTHPRATTGDGR
jgi:nucleoside-diphosphate-sugar epimerase